MCYLLKKYFWWLLRRVKNLRSTACKQYRKYDVIYRYLHIELIWCLLMAQYLQNNVITKWTTRFIGWIPLKIRLDHNSTYYRSLSKNSDVKPRISHHNSPNLQYKTHPEFWPSHRRIFKTSFNYKMHLISETRRYSIFVISFIQLHMSSLVDYMAKLIWEWKPRFTVVLVVRSLLLGRHIPIMTSLAVPSLCKHQWGQTVVQDVKNISGPRFL